MSLDVFLERSPVAVCQCDGPCLQPITDEAGHLVETAGCLLRKDHEGPHGLDGTTEFTYRERPTSTGPRLVFRQEQPGGIFRATCWRCHAEYALTVTGLRAETAQEIVADEAQA